MTRLDNLFENARFQQVVLAREEAIRLASESKNSSPGKRWPAGMWILGIVVILSATAWILFQKQASAPSSRDSLTLTEDLPAPGIKQTELPVRKNLPDKINGSPFLSPLAPVDAPSGSGFSAASDPEAPPFAPLSSYKTPSFRVAKANIGNNPVVLNYAELKKLGIKANEYHLEYELSNSPRSEFAHKLIIDKKQDRVETYGGDTLQDQMFSGDRAFAIFVTYGPKGNWTMCMDVVERRFVEEAFLHFKDQLMPIQVTLVYGDREEDVIFYFPVTPALLSLLPADVKEHYSSHTFFDFNEYKRYRQMTWEREEQYQKDISLSAPVVKDLMQKAVFLKNPDEIKTLGLDYDGRTIRDTICVYYRDSLFYISTFRSGYKGTYRFSTYLPLSDPQAKQMNLAISTVYPLVISDSALRSAEVLKWPADYENRDITKQNLIAREAAFKMVDTLVPVIIPVKPTRKAERQGRKFNYPVPRYVVLWYRPTPEFINRLPERFRSRF